MDSKEIIGFVDTQILQSMDGAAVENMKFDLKYKWYDLKSEEGINEFLKDCSAIVNSYGKDGFIVIGFDEKQKEFKSSPLTESGLHDESEIIGLIRRKVDKPFNIQVLEYDFTRNETKSRITIIHLPYSLDKPHVVRNYKKGNQQFPNEIFVRKGTTNDRASKNDLDIMYSENRGSLPDRRVVISFDAISFYFQEPHFLCMVVSSSIENCGTRPISIIGFRFEIKTGVSPVPMIQMTQMKENHTDTITVDANRIEKKGLLFHSTTTMTKHDAQILLAYGTLLISQMAISHVKLVLNTGEEIEPELNITR